MEGTALSDLGELDVATITWRNLTLDPAAGTGPSERAFLCVAAAGGDLYAFGGMDGTREALAVSTHTQLALMILCKKAGTLINVGTLL